MKWITFLFIFFCGCLHAHDGHTSKEVLSSLVQWIGQFHPVLLHFPIVLILMAGVSEAFYLFTKNKAYDFSVTFLLISAVIMAIPTVLAGWAFSEGGVYEGDREELMDLHEFFGVSTLFLSMAILWLRLYSGKRWLYLTGLCILIVCVCTAAHFGGELTFGPFKWLPTL